MQPEMLHDDSLSHPCSERRRYPRKRVTGCEDPFVIEVSSGNRCYILDISEGGMRLRSDSYAHFPPQGKFAVTLPDSDQSVEVTAQLAWVSRTGTAGLQFLEVNSTLQESLTAWITATRQCTRAERAASIPIITPMSLTSLREKVLVLKSKPKALQMIARQMMVLTRATGAVIAIEQEAGGDITCVASAGSAPALGAVLKTDSGLSGECVRTGTIIRCEDAASDSGVNVIAARTLGFRSMLVLPLRVQQRTVGVLEVLSAEPYHFDNDDVVLLTDVADLILNLCFPPQTQAEAKPQHSSSKAEVPAEAAQEKTGPKLELIKRKPEPRMPTEATSAQTAPDAPTGSGVASYPISPITIPPAVAQAASHSTMTGNSACDVCGYKNAAGAVDCKGCDVPLPLAVELERKGIRSRGFEIPERDDRWERLASALLRPVLFLVLFVVTSFLIWAHWIELHTVPQSLQTRHASIKAAPPTGQSRPQ